MDGRTYPPIEHRDTQRACDVGSGDLILDISTIHDHIPCLNNQFIDANCKWTYIFEDGTSAWWNVATQKNLGFSLNLTNGSFLMISNTINHSKIIRSENWRGKMCLVLDCRFLDASTHLFYMRLRPLVRWSVGLSVTHIFKICKIVWFWLLRWRWCRGEGRGKRSGKGWWGRGW